MSITSEKINGKEILVEIESSNLKSASYNTEDETLQVTFKNIGSGLIFYWLAANRLSAR